MADCRDEGDFRAALDCEHELVGRDDKPWIDEPVRIVNAVGSELFGDALKRCVRSNDERRP